MTHDEVSQAAAEKAEREQGDRLLKEEELEILQEEFARLVARKQEVDVKIQRQRPVWNFMKEVLKMTTVLQDFYCVYTRLRYYNKQFPEFYTTTHKMSVFTPLTFNVCVTV